ncbi:MAG: hypothetical protein AABO57_25825 [Acidobacteriota bacterium]
MKSVMAIFLLLTSGFSMDGSSKAKGWRGIVPLYSTRADVERLLGPPANKGDCIQSLCSYYLDDVNVHFNYSPGDCKSGRGIWNVPPGTVVWITVYPKPNTRLSDLKIDESKFKKGQKGHIEAEISYENEEEGLTLMVYEGMVQTFLYGPAGKDQHLRCP